MTDIIWEDPPAATQVKRGRKGIWLERLAGLSEYPGKWARVADAKDYVAAVAQVRSLKKGEKEMPPGHFEFVAREVEANAEGKSGAIFARATTDLSMGVEVEVPVSA